YVWRNRRCSDVRERPCGIYHEGKPESFGYSEVVEHQAHCTDRSRGNGHIGRRRAKRCSLPLPSEERIAVNLEPSCVFLSARTLERVHRCPDRHINKAHLFQQL